MNEELAKNLIDDVADARALLYNGYCENAINEKEMVIHLAGQLLLQACVCLHAVYEGDLERVRKHAIILLVKGTEQPNADVS